MKKLLLTGATGFVGHSCVAPLQARGYSLHTISTGRRAAPDGVTSWFGDLLDIESLTKLLEKISPTHLLHVAWDVTPGAYWTASANFDWLVAGEALLRAFLAVGGTRAVGVGTCAEYGWTVDRYAELEAPVEPATAYGQTKLALGRAFEAAERHGVSSAWARLFFPFGPGEQFGRLLPSVISLLLAGRPADCTAGSQSRDFLFIDDVGGALAALVDSEVTGPVNIGSGTGIKLGDFIMMVARQIGRPELVRLGALPMRAGDPASIIADITRLEGEVGFRPAIPLAVAIQKTVAYWASQTHPTKASVDG